jgi:hypothetical protein
MSWRSVVCSYNRRESTEMKPRICEALACAQKPLQVDVAAGVDRHFSTLMDQYEATRESGQ